MYPTITFTQTGLVRRGKRDVAYFTILSDTHGVIATRLTLRGAIAFARGHLYWVGAMMERFPGVPIREVRWDYGWPT